MVRVRVDTAALWTSNNPTLARGEVGYENDTQKVKVGDGVTAWTSLLYLAGGGTGDALVANPLSQFAATTSAQLAGVISNETGSGSLVFATSPALVTPTGIVKGDVGLGNVDNTSDASKPVSTATQTALDLKAPLASPTFTGTVTVPTGAALNTPASVNLSNATALPAAALPAMTGDVTASAGSHATTLANSGVTAASYGSSSAVAVITVDVKGRITSATSTTISVGKNAATRILARQQFR